LADLTALLAGTIVSGVVKSGERTKFAETGVPRSNLVEPDETLRLVVTGKARLTGVIIQESRPYAGVP